VKGSGFRSEGFRIFHNLQHWTWVLWGGLAVFDNFPNGSCPFLRVLTLPCDEGFDNYSKNCKPTEREAFRISLKNENSLGNQYAKLGFETEKHYLFFSNSSFATSDRIYDSR